jgi:ankyrin repeat protein
MLRKKSSVDTIELVLANGASLTAVCSLGHSAFLIAAEAGNLPAAEFLLRHPLSLHDQDSSGNTALHLAALGDRVSMIRWLMSLGAFADQVNKFGQTHLSRACTYGQLDVAVALIELGADVDRPG